MDKHYLTSLFSPASIVVFAGSRADPADAASSSGLARLLHEDLRAQRFNGTLHFLDIETSGGTLGELAQ